MRRLIFCLFLVSCGSGSDGSLRQTSCKIGLAHTAGAVYRGDITPCKYLLENNTGGFRFTFSAVAKEPSLGALRSVVVGPLAFEFESGEAVFSATSVSFSREYPNIDRDGSSVQLPLDGLTEPTATFSFGNLSEENYPLVVKIEFELIEPR